MSMNLIKISANLSLCECFSPENYAKFSKLVNNTQKLRDMLGKPIYITSGFRTPAKMLDLKQKGYNPAPDSRHMYFQAFDIVWTGIQKDRADKSLNYWLSLNFDYYYFSNMNHLHVQIN